MLSLVLLQFSQHGGTELKLTIEGGLKMEPDELNQATERLNACACGSD
jgi:hypothetical protein